MVVLFSRSSVVVDVPLYADLVSCSLIGPLVPRGTKCCSLIGCVVKSRGILLFTNVSMYLVFATNWGHKKIRNNNNNVYTIKICSMYKLCNKTIGI